MRAAWRRSSAAAQALGGMARRQQVANLHEKRAGASQRFAGETWRWGATTAALVVSIAGVAALSSGDATLTEGTPNTDKEEGRLNRSASRYKILGKSKEPHPCSVKNEFSFACPEVKVFCGNANPALAAEVAAALGVDLGSITVDKFADGEVNIKIHESVRGKDVYIVQPTCPPVNEHVMELLLMVSAMRHASAKRVTVVLPYFGYMRSLTPPVNNRDKMDWNYGRSNLAAKDVALMLEISGAQRVVSVDMYPPGMGLAEGFFESAPIEHLWSSDHVAGDLIDVLSLKDTVKKDNELVVMSPHASCLTKAKLFRNEIHERLNKTIGLATIIRTAPPPKSKNQERLVDIVGDVKGKSVLIVEDLIETGHITETAVNAAMKAGAKEVFVFASHCMLRDNAAQRLEASPIKKLVTLNTVPISKENLQTLTKLRQISIAPPVAAILKRMHYESK
mmetsp:Transcript_8276/g.14646  ORF Transcript_8276/g.14646 Transcript_8276/m.14646 type:complete len:450 (+) Transcript_8276:146-1495(+)